MTDYQLPRSLNLLQTSIRELSGLLVDGGITSVNLVRAYIANIDRDNLKGMELRAVIQVATTDFLIQIAQSLDDERSRGLVRSPLHGIPILLKDTLATDPELGMATTGGAVALQNSVVQGDAEIVKRLRDAGAIILAKANLTELSKYLNEDMPNGWSAVGGQTSSAYVKGGDPRGSSSGCAVGISAGFGAAAVASEHVGSITGPSSRAALFGIRPSTGLLSTNGIIPVRYFLASQKPTMKSLRLGLAHTHFVEGEGRLYWPGTAPRENEAAILSAVEDMRRSGAIVVDVDIGLTASDISEFVLHEKAVWSLGFRDAFEGYLSQLKESPVRTLKDLVDFNEETGAKADPPVKPSQQLLVDALLSPGMDSEQYRRAMAASTDIARIRGLDRLFDENNLDAAIFPIDIGLAQMLVGASAYAAGTAPLGYYDSIDGAPFGVLFVVRPREEEKLIQILSAFEKMSPKRRTPPGL